MNNDNNPRSKKWIIECNNFNDYGLDKEKTLNILNSMNPIWYCYSEEIGIESKLHHWHINVNFNNAISFNSLKNKFGSSIHLEKQNGSNQDAKDYTFKEGKWIDDPKGDTNLRDTHVEFGEMPIEHQGKRNDILVAKNMIDDGYSVDDVVDEVPTMALRMDKLEDYQARRIESKYRGKYRKIDCTYIYGPPRVGKTSYVYHKNKRINVFAVDNYDKWPFDGYNHEDVLLLDEFKSQFDVSDTLRYLDGQPLKLQVKNSRRQACYTKIYIVSNWPLEEQYHDLQVTDKLTYEAWLSRIHHVIEWKDKNNQFYYEIEDYFNNRQFNFKNLNIKMEDLFDEE